MRYTVYYEDPAEAERLGEHPEIHVDASNVREALDKFERAKPNLVPTGVALAYQSIEVIL